MYKMTSEAKVPTQIRKITAEKYPENKIVEKLLIVFTLYG